MRRAEDELVPIVEYGEVTSEFREDGKYSLTTGFSEYRLTLTDVFFDDSSDYHCLYQINHWFSFFLTSGLRYQRLSAQLDVIDAVSERPDDDCVLLSDTGGIYFTGDKIVISCPHRAINVTVEGHPNFKILQKQIVGSGNYLIVSSPLDESYDGANLSCLFGIDENAGNYCENFPAITVYNNLTVDVRSSGVIDIEDGCSKIEWRCSSNLNEVATLEWEIFNPDHLSMIGNITTDETANGTILVMTSSQFALSGQQQLVVARCGVSFGLKTAEDYAIIDGTKIETTTPRHEEGTTTTSPTTSSPVGGHLCVGVGVIVVLILVTAVLCFVIALLFHLKISRRWQTKHVRLEDEDTLM